MCRLPFSCDGEAFKQQQKQPQKKWRRNTGVTGNLVAAQQTSVDAVVGAVLSELDGILRSKEELRAALKAFLGGKRCLPFRPEWLWQEFS